MPEKKVTCQLCGSRDLKPLFTFRDFNIVRCSACGLVFRDILLGSDDAKNLYSKEYFTDEQADYFFNNADEKERLFRDRLKIVEAHVIERGRILDVGCAIGTFLKIARDSGWKCRGAEISDYASRFAREEYRLDVTGGEFDSAKFASEEKFDVVTMWDVVDHSEDPIRFLKEAVSLLKPGGRIFVQTTMEDSLVYEVCRYSYLFTFGVLKGPAAKGHPVHHSTFFSRRTLAEALKRCGLNVIGTEVSEYPAKFFPGGPLSRAAFGLFYNLGNHIGKPLVVTFIAGKDIG